MTKKTKIITKYEIDLVADLFFEQEDKILGTCYKSGFIYSIYVIFRAFKFFSIKEKIHSHLQLEEGTRTAVVFFLNELNAIQKSHNDYRVDNIIKLSTNNLSIIRSELGIKKTIIEIFNFILLTRKYKGFQYFRKMGYPTLGWLLYKTFSSILENVNNATIITTNMQHPLSIGVATAAFVTDNKSEFYEHSMTPKKVMHRRRYNILNVDLRHTAVALQDKKIVNSCDTINILKKNMHPSIEFNISNVKLIGVCVNDLDSLNEVEMIIKLLINLHYNVKLRVHDADSRYRVIQKLSEKYKTPIESAKSTHIVDYLNKVDLVICGNSNVLIDAVKHKTPVVYYWNGDQALYDYYGIVRYFKLTTARSKEDLKSIFLEK
jgi:hypothetical protein